MVYAMLIMFVLFLYIQTSYCQTTITNCTFINQFYSNYSAVRNQFQFPNQTSVILTSSYGFFSPTNSQTTFEIGLIYQFPSIADLVPFPIVLTCSSNIISCQLETMAGTTSITRLGEPITVNLININYTSINSSRKGLYLRQGQYQLSRCLLDNGQSITDNQTIFNIQIQYEKSVGTSCTPSVDTCGSSNLTTCSSESSTCTCLSPDSLVSYMNASFCADTYNRTNCTLFPTRCISWCDSTTNILCQCPDGTLKILRNNVYVCELAVNSANCSSSDQIRRCPFGQVCLNGQCVNEIQTSTSERTTITTDMNQSSDSTDQRLRIALGVIAGLLGTSVLILLGIFCWLRYRRKQRRLTAEKSFSPSSSVTSSLYISPVQQRDHQRKYPTVYHLPVDTSPQRISNIYRTDSFRQAVLAGHNRSNLTNEYISTRRDSLPFDNDELDSQAYSSLENVLPPQTIPNHHNIYQVIMPSFSPTILTHAV